MAEDSFPALPGVYRLLFLYLEPISTITPALMVWIFPGATWFYQELIPSALSAPTGALEPRSLMAIWQLVNCYFLLGLISSLVFRAVRDALPNNPAAQERILGASFLALGIADLTHIAATFVGLPADLRYTPSAWNSMTHGSISAVVVLCAWWAGIGRTRYYFGQPHNDVHKRK
ncbi:hypothetical protein D9619_003064 [Psilocybe cf. subviscida]|uniref:DUF7704 domain-containing protein n=1 Tax=Psilocybe cf. subviscida TaxID=2480587 RepID=A0A8H5EU95_9AGAR|nr:hypothetical protein D9619_003064 [Psilocybe cf. subviscida]